MVTDPIIMMGFKIMTQLNDKAQDVHTWISTNSRSIADSSEAIWVLSAAPSDALSCETRVCSERAAATAPSRRGTSCSSCCLWDGGGEQGKEGIGGGYQDLSLGEKEAAGKSNMQWLLPQGFSSGEVCSRANRNPQACSPC